MTTSAARPRGAGHPALAHLILALLVLCCLNFAACDDDGVTAPCPVCPGPGPVFEGDVIVRSQDEVESLRGIERISGRLQIQSGTSVTDLTPLAGLRAVGRLSIGSNMALASLAGLDSVDVAPGGVVEITSNPLLEDLRGLGSVRSARFLLLRGNTGLMSLAGLPPMPTLQAARIESCPA
ncbi:MAG: hypothetical protein R6X35_12260, partial [Candidatus Krumholzibacteriia bacterium]